MAEAQKRSLIFMGTPEFAAIVLERLLGESGLDVAAVFTGADKKAGRGMKIMRSPVKEIALREGLPLYQPGHLRSPETAAIIGEINPHFLIVAAYGLILPASILASPQIAPLNVHPSLLPAWRGAAPIQRAIMAGWRADAKTGVSIMRMTPRLDAGPVYHMREYPVRGQNAQELTRTLARAGADLLVETIMGIDAGTLRAVEQDEACATYAEKVRREEREIDWQQPCAQVDARIRALYPWPGATARLQFMDKSAPVPVAIVSGKPGSSANLASPGSILRHGQGLSIACADAWYDVEQLCPQNRKSMSARDFVNGQTSIKNGVCGHIRQAP